MQKTKLLCCQQVTINILRSEGSNNLLLFKLHLFIFVCIGRNEHAMVYMWRPEDNLQELVQSFYHMGPRTPIQAIKP